MLQVIRGVFCWTLSVTIRRLQGFSNLYGQRQNYRALLIRGTTGAASMIAYYFSLQFLPLGDTVSDPSLGWCPSTALCIWRCVMS